jgi:D-alanine-D-alanine ligase
MARWRVGILYETSGNGDAEAPRERPSKSSTTSRRERKRTKKKRARPKHDREEIFEVLKAGGHDPFYHALDGEPDSLLAVADLEADLFFNLTESFAGDDTKEMNVAAYLELLGQRFTGTGPQGLYLAQDKALAKKIFAFHGIRTPVFATCYRGRLDWAHDVTFPVIVKPALEDGSIGIDFRAVVSSIKELMAQIDRIHAEFDTPVLIEEYIEGREIYVALLGNGTPEVLPIVELDLSRLPKGTPRIAGTEVKWGEGTEAFRDTQPFFPDDLEPAQVEEIHRTAVAAYQALKLRDYGRVDFRVATDGTPHVIEVNPNPWLLSTAEFALAAKKSGRAHAELIDEIVDLALARPL